MLKAASRLSRLGNPLEWSPVDKGILISGMMIPMQLGYIAYCLVAMRMTTDGELFDFAEVRIHINFLWSFVIIGSLTCLYGYWLRTRNPDSMFFQHVAAQVYAVSMCIIGYRIGMMSIVTGVVLTGAPLVCYVFFARQTVYAATVSSMLLIAAGAYAGSSGLLPYAPILAPHQLGGETSSFWVSSMLLLFVLPQLAWFYAMGIYVVYRWRQREQEVRELAVRDPLTGIANRRHIMDIFDHEVRRSTRMNSPLSVIMVDLDHFKHINDRHGHQTGDKVLKAAASILENSIRNTDLVGRFGGEEFIILLPDTTLERACEVAERCRAQLQSVSIAAAHTSLNISGSLGVGCHADWSNPVNSDLIIQRADEALYEAKGGGRNRVVAGQCG